VILNQGIYGVVILVTNSDIKKSEDELNQVVQKLLELKKQPFTDVYVKMPSLLFQKFLDKLAENNIKYKEAEFKHQQFLIKF
jgi:hypothetical protein